MAAQILKQPPLLAYPRRRPCSDAEEPVVFLPGLHTEVRFMFGIIIITLPSVVIAVPAGRAGVISAKEKKFGKHRKFSYRLSSASR
jgi:hypothetical protein